MHRVSGCTRIAYSSELRVLTIVDAFCQLFSITCACLRTCLRSACFVERGHRKQVVQSSKTKMPFGSITSAWSVVGVNAHIERTADKRRLHQCREVRWHSYSTHSAPENCGHCELSIPKSVRFSYFYSHWTSRLVHVSI